MKATRISQFSLITCLITLTATQCIQAGTFRDDFEDGDLEGWRQDAPKEPMLWEVVDGELQCTRHSDKSAVLITGDVTWKDYTISYDVKLLKAHGKGDFDVLVRYNGWWKRLLLFVIGDFCAPDGACVQRAPDLDFKAGKPFNSLELNRWYHIELEVKGDKFTLGIDEKEVLFYRDNTIKSGAVGLGLANYTARFDNIEITGPDVPDVTPPTWKPRPVDPNEKLPTMWGKIKRNR